MTRPRKKKLGIFSKFDICGGSELRCAEIANAIHRYSPSYTSSIFCPKTITKSWKAFIDNKIPVYEKVFTDHLDALYELDCLLVVNTDSQVFTKVEYWQGKTDKHNVFVDLTRMKQMVYLFNYVISPARHLAEIEQYCPDVKILVTNTKFFQEIPRRFPGIIHLPRMIIESPIEPNTISPDKKPSNKVRVGCLSKPVHDKWNTDWADLIDHTNNVVGRDKMEWRFLGCPDSLREKLSVFDNTVFHKQFSIPVKTFLEELDIFVFLPSFSREEPWSRSIAEALLSGCPVVTTSRGGSTDQIVHGNNGLLCDDLDGFKWAVTELSTKPYALQAMRRICLKRSEYFTSPQVIKRLIDFIEW